MINGPLFKSGEFSWLSRNDPWCCFNRKQVRTNHISITILPSIQCSYVAHKSPIFHPLCLHYWLNSEGLCLTPLTSCLSWSEMCSLRGIIPVFCIPALGGISCSQHCRYLLLIFTVGLLSLSVPLKFPSSVGESTEAAAYSDIKVNRFVFLWKIPYLKKKSQIHFFFTF